MQNMVEIDLRHIVPFARVQYHDGFNAFGMHFNGLGEGGRTSDPETENRLVAGQLEVVHTHGSKPKYEIGEKTGLAYSNKRWQVVEIANLGLGKHEFALETTHAHGFAYLVKAIAEAGSEVSLGE